jgi:branched-chain amino acid transport system permease protein
MDGVTVGSLYALIALGYTMVYGILKFINFAHGDVFMLGVWIAYTIAKAMGLAAPGADVPWYASILVLLLSMATCGAIGFVIERLAYRPLRGAPRLNVLITAIGVSLLLENAGQLPFFFGTQPQSMPALLPDQVVFTLIGTVQVRLVDIIGFFTTVTLMVIMEWLVFRTKLGLAMRAVSHDPKVASLMGVPVDRVISFTFVIGSTLAAAAGFLYAMKYPGINQPAHTTWILLGLKAFVAAVVGGIGNIRGAILGGLLIGMIEQGGAAYINSNLRDVYVFTLLIIVLLVKPTGILGKTTLEKV